MIELTALACTITAILAARAGDTIVASAAVMSLAALALAYCVIA